MIILIVSVLDLNNSRFKLYLNKAFSITKFSVSFRVMFKDDRGPLKS